MITEENAPYHGSCWDSRDLRILRDEFIKGKTVDQIAEILGRTTSACNVRLHIIRTSILLSKEDGTTIRDVQLREK